MFARPSSVDQDHDHDFGIREPPKPARRTACSRRRPAFPLSTIGQLFIPDSMPIRVMLSFVDARFVILLNQTRVRLCIVSVFAMDTPL